MREAIESAAPACGEPGRDAKHRFKIFQTLSENLSLQQLRPFRRAAPGSARAIPIPCAFGAVFIKNRIQNRFENLMDCLFDSYRC